MARGWHRVGFPAGYTKDDLTVIGERIPVHDKRSVPYLYPCRCTCGNSVLLSAAQILANRSCGCRGEQARRSLPEHNRTHGGSGTRLYAVWCAMRRRCSRDGLHNSRRYFGKGIRVCDEWQNDFAAFRRWALENGYASELQLDRIDNDGDYEPANCRWVTCAQNNRNRDRDTRIAAFGETKCAMEWSRDSRCSVSDSSILYRLRKLGWSAESAITVPAFDGKQVFHTGRQLNTTKEFAR